MSQSTCCNTTSTSHDVAKQTPTYRVRPSVDLIENEQGFVMYVELPGVPQNNLEVNIEKNVLSIRGVAEFSAPEGFRSVAGETGRRSYERSFQLSDDIARDGIDAELKNGVLTLTLPKSARAQRSSIAVRMV